MRLLMLSVFLVPVSLFAETKACTLAEGCVNFTKQLKSGKIGECDVTFDVTAPAARSFEVGLTVKLPSATYGMHFDLDETKTFTKEAPAFMSEVPAPPTGDRIIHYFGAKEMPLGGLKGTEVNFTVCPDRSVCGLEVNTWSYLSSKSDPTQLTQVARTQQKLHCGKVLGN